MNARLVYHGRYSATLIRSDKPEMSWLELFCTDSGCRVRAVEYCWSHNIDFTQEWR